MGSFLSRSGLQLVSERTRPNQAPSARSARVSSNEDLRMRGGALYSNRAACATRYRDSKVDAIFRRQPLLRQGPQTAFSLPNSTVYRLMSRIGSKPMRAPCLRKTDVPRCYPHVDGRGRDLGFYPLAPELVSTGALGETKFSTGCPQQAKEASTTAFESSGRARRPAGGARKIVRGAPVSNRKKAVMCAFVSCKRNY